MLQPTNIIKRNIRGKESVWISESDISLLCGIELDYLKTKARYYYSQNISGSKVKELKNNDRQLLPDTGKSWRYGKINGQYYYCYDNIPDRAPNFTRSKLPSKEELLRLAEEQPFNPNSVKENIKTLLTEAFQKEFQNQDIHYYMYDSGFALSPAKAEYYAKRRAWLQVISEFDKKKIYKLKGMRTEGEFYNTASTLTGDINLRTGGTLRKEVHYYDRAENKRDFVISGKEGNQNARVIGVNKVTNIETGEIFDLDIHEAIFYHAWINPGHHGKYLKTDVYNTYCEEIEKHGFAPLAERTINKYLNKYSTRAKASLERDGKSHFTDKYLPQIRQFKPKYVGTLWAADFSGTKLAFRYEVIDKKTGKKKWKPGSWYLFRVVDAATGYIVGWSVVPDGGKGEKWEEVRSGLNMALENNSGMMAMELVTDKGSVFTSRENRQRLALLFDKHRLIDNKRANIAETYVRLLNQQARYFDEFVGKTSFAATHIDNQANPDYVAINNLGTKDEVLSKVVQLIQNWNNSPRRDGTIPAEEFSKRERNPQLKPLEEKAKRFALGNKTTISIGRQVGSLITNKHGEDHIFHIQNWTAKMEEIDKALGGCPDLRVNVYWDSEKADIYTPENEYITSAIKSPLSHASEYEGTKESRAAFEEGKKQQARMQRDARDFADDVVAARNSLDFDEENIESIVDELTYEQRAKLNNGRAKDEHNEIMEKHNSPLPPDDDFEIDFDPTNDY